MTFDDLTAPVTDLGVDFPGATSEWRWLVPRDAKPLMITSMGDVFVEIESEISFVDTTRGTMEAVAVSREEWKRHLQDRAKVAKWFQPGLVKELLEHRRLRAGEVFSPVVPPILGGKGSVENYTPSQWRMHLHVMGQIHHQVRNLPAGTTVTFVS
jgi:Domain of unknown function (DUF1851).